MEAEIERKEVDPFIIGNEIMEQLKQPTIEFGNNRLKIERKQQKKRVKFYTRQAKRNSTKQFV